MASQIPDWSSNESFPQDTTRPSIPYAQMIMQAIESSSEQKSTLKDIYEYVTDRYPFFKQSRSGWKNSIRHNLSLNKNFIRVPRPANEKGKGAYWAVNPDQDSIKKPSKKIYSRKRYTIPPLAFPNNNLVHRVSSAAEHYVPETTRYGDTEQESFNAGWEVENHPVWNSRDYSQLDHLLDLGNTSSSTNMDYFIDQPSSFQFCDTNTHAAKDENFQNDPMLQYFDAGVWFSATKEQGKDEFMTDPYQVDEYSVNPWQSIQ